MEAASAKKLKFEVGLTHKIDLRTQTKHRKQSMPTPTVTVHIRRSIYFDNPCFH